MLDADRDSLIARKQVAYETFINEDGLWSVSDTEATRLRDIADKHRALRDAAHAEVARINAIFSSDEESL